jgi:GntR family transcriptional repressor for pyruvate dehydrogenase complex
MQLPPERDLARYLGVSRASLREALTVLQMTGMVATLSGQGTFICEKPKTTSVQVTLPDAGESPFLILQARKIIEPAIAGIAAVQHTEASLKEIEQILNSIEADHAKIQVISTVFSEGDRDFHLAIAQSTGNPILISMQEMIYSLTGQKLWLALMRSTSFTTPGRWGAALNEHRGIFEAIKIRDHQLATNRVKAHLSLVEKLMKQAELTTHIPE